MQKVIIGCYIIWIIKRRRRRIRNLLIDQNPAEKEQNNEDIGKDIDKDNEDMGWGEKQWNKFR